eukprot:1180917-Prorocentrum_minimum.AAC.4
MTGELPPLTGEFPPLTGGFPPLTGECSGAVELWSPSDYNRRHVNGQAGNGNTAKVRVLEWGRYSNVPGRYLLLL